MTSTRATPVTHADPSTADRTTTWAWRIGPASFRVRRRDVAVAAALLLALLGALALALCVGRTYVTLPDVVATLLGRETGYERVIGVMRLPRIGLAVLAGAAFGMAGALIQTVARNPLASPDVIGVTQGAGLAATIALTTGLGAAWLTPVAGLGGMAAAVIVLMLGLRQGMATHRFVLAGIAVAVILRSLTQINLLAAAPIEAQRAQIWLVGTLSGRGWSHAEVIGVVLVVLLVPLVWAARAGRTVALDDDTARGLGVRIGSRRLFLAGIGVLLASAATSTVGAVEFVALAAPQVARRLARADRPSLLSSALVGAVLVVLADWVGRTAFGSYQMPVGVLTAAVGGPYLLFLLIRSGRTR